MSGNDRNSLYGYNMGHGSSLLNSTYPIVLFPPVLLQVMSSGWCESIGQSRLLLVTSSYASEIEIKFEHFITI